MDKSSEQLLIEIADLKARLAESMRERQVLEQTRESLRASEERFRRYFELGLIGIAISSPTKGIIEINDELCKILGYEKSELLQKTWADLTHPDDLTGELASFNRVLEGEIDGYYREKRLIHKDGRIIDSLLSVKCMRRTDNSVDYFVGLVQDITEKKRAEAALRRGKELSEALNLINESLHSALEPPEITQRLVDVATAALGCETAGVSLRDGDGWVVSHVNGMPASLVGTRISDEKERHALLAIQTGRPVEVTDAFNDERFNREHLRKHNIRSVLVAPLIGRSGPIGAIFFNYHSAVHSFGPEEVHFAAQLGATAAIAIENARLFDERERARKSLRESEERLAAVFENLTEGLIIADGNGRIIYWNQAALAIHGYACMDEYRRKLAELADTFEGQPLNEDRLLPVADWPINRVLRGEILRDYEVRVRRPDQGWEKIIAYSGSLIRSASGGKIAFLSITDITKPKQVEKTLRQNQKTFAELIERAPFGVYVVDAQFRVAHMNANSQNGAFRNVRPVIGRNFNEVMRILWPKPVADEIVGHFRHTLETGEPYYSPRFTNPRHDVNVTESYEWELHRMTLPDGQYGVICYYYDSTKLRDTEAALRALNQTLEMRVTERTALAETRTRQLQALAVELIEAEERERRRVSELLHEDLQQMLAAARFQLQAAFTELPPELANLDSILDESIAKMRRMSHDLSPAVLHQSGLVAGLEWLARQKNERFGMQVQIENRARIHLKSSTLNIFIFRAVQELLFNIVKHAGVKTAKVSLSQSGGHFDVAVSDAGKGFDPAILESLPVKSGFGLLSLRERASYIGGKLDIQSAPGQGSRFILTVPLDEATQTQQFATDIDCEPGLKRGSFKPVKAEGIRVLFADDHKVIRHGLIKLILENPGIQVVGEAANGWQALELARQLRPDVIVMDISMPRMDGIETTRRIKAELPDIRVIGLSMFDDEPIIGRMREAGAETTINKQASSSELLSAIYGMKDKV